MSLGENIRKRRKERKLSQECVAEQLGVSRQAVSKWETGQSEPTAGNLIQLAEILEISLSELVDAKETRTDQKPTEPERPKKAPNLILRANLIKLAVIMQAFVLFRCTSTLYQLRSPAFPDKDLYRGALIVSLIQLALCSLWMASNHRYESDLHQRRKNVWIEFAYCCVQLFVGLLTVRFGLGLVGGALIAAVAIVYLLYINPRFMSRKLTK